MYWLLALLAEVSIFDKFFSFLLLIELFTVEFAPHLIRWMGFGSTQKYLLIVDFSPPLFQFLLPVLFSFIKCIHPFWEIHWEFSTNDECCLFGALKTKILFFARIYPCWVPIGNRNYFCVLLLQINFHKFTSKSKSYVELWRFFVDHIQSKILCKLKLQLHAIRRKKQNENKIEMNDNDRYTWFVANEIQTKSVCGVKFASTQREELTVTEAILKNHDPSSESENNARERTKGKPYTKVVWTEQHTSERWLLCVLLHMMTVEAVNVVACCSANTWTDIKPKPNEWNPSSCVWMCVLYACGECGWL